MLKRMALKVPRGSDALLKDFWTRMTAKIKGKGYFLLALARRWKDALLFLSSPPRVRQCHGSGISKKRRNLKKSILHHLTTKVRALGIGSMYMPWT